MPFVIDIRKLKTKTFTKSPVRGHVSAVFHTGLRPDALQQAQVLVTG
jgi:hypothetical protein